MQRLRLIRPPQAGHRCFELKLSPCIADNDFRGDSCRDGGHRIEISGRDRIPREMGFSGPIYQTRSAIDPPSRATLAVRASETGLSAYV